MNIYENTIESFIDFCDIQIANESFSDIVEKGRNFIHWVIEKLKKFLGFFTKIKEFFYKMKVVKIPKDMNSDMKFLIDRCNLDGNYYAMDTLYNINNNKFNEKIFVNTEGEYLNIAQHLIDLKESPQKARLDKCDYNFSDCEKLNFNPIKKEIDETNKYITGTIRILENDVQENEYAVKFLKVMLEILQFKANILSLYGKYCKFSFKYLKENSVLKNINFDKLYTSTYKREYKRYSLNKEDAIEAGKCISVMTRENLTDYNEYVNAYHQLKSIFNIKENIIFGHFEGFLGRINDRYDVLEEKINKAIETDGFVGINFECYYESTTPVKLLDNTVVYHVSNTPGLTALNPTFRSIRDNKYYRNKRVYFSSSPINIFGSYLSECNEDKYIYVPAIKINRFYRDAEYSGIMALYTETDNPIPVKQIDFNEFKNNILNKMKYL